MFTYKYTNRPSFLEGAFHWKKTGYSYKNPPTIKLLSEEALHSEEPWIMLASAVEYAKLGKLKDISYLKRLVVYEETDPTLVDAILNLIADTGGKTDLEMLAELMFDASSKYLKLRACQSAKWAGEIWLVPFILEVWKGLDRQADRDAVEAVISNLLDPLEGPELEFFDGNYQEHEYCDKVIRYVNAMVDKFGSDRISILGGEPIDMSKLIWRMRKMLHSRDDGWIDWGAFLLLRHKFEAYTGADCSEFYKGNSFQPLTAAHVIERFVENHPDHVFEVGGRYFFLHSII